MPDDIKKESGKPIIEVIHAKKSYHMGQEHIRAVDDVSFTINKGEFTCLLGTSGSGKSTLLNVMSGIEKLSGGDIKIKGQTINKMSENKLARFRQENLGFVFQAYNLLGSMTALENVELPLVFKRVPAAKRKKMAKRMLAKVGLKTRMNHKPSEMSGGQQQRVGIARAFVGGADIVFADEPTGNLDSKTTIEVMELIKQIAIDNNQTIVMVTHDEKLTEYADRVIRIMDGKVIGDVHNDHPRMPGDGKSEEGRTNTENAPAEKTADAAAENAGSETVNTENASLNKSEGKK